MLVYDVGAVQQLLETVEADGKGDGQADSRPQREPSPHPIPELEHVGGVDAEGRHLLSVRGEGDEMLSDGGLVFGPGQEPGPGRVGVGHRLLGGEGLGGDEEQGGLRAQALERLGDIGSIDVGDEVKTQAGMNVGRQGFDHHLRAQVGAADADVDDVGDRLAGVALPLARPHALAERAHVRQDAVDIGHHISPIDIDGSVGAIAQGDVQHGPVLGDVDFLAAEHGGDGSRRAGPVEPGRAGGPSSAR